MDAMDVAGDNQLNVEADMKKQVRKWITCFTEVSRWALLVDKTIWLTFFCDVWDGVLRDNVHNNNTDTE